MKSERKNDFEDGFMLFHAAAKDKLIFFFFLFFWFLKNFLDA